EEGWATLYGDPFTFFSPGDSVSEVLQRLDEAGDLSANKDYNTAARFVAFLLERHGVDVVRALCETDIESSADFEAALLAITGESLDALNAEFEGNPVFNAMDAYVINRLQQDLACEDGGLPVVTSPGSWTHDLRCSGAMVEGRRGQWVMSEQLVELPESGRYTFGMVTDRELWFSLELHSCTQVASASIYYNYNPLVLWAEQYDELQYPIEGELSAGIYVLRLWADDSDNDSAILDDSLTIDFSVNPTP
ncbi:MAG: hypothetical protein KC431_27105, partial [Myxococcales bacterium]|nr:hypothetical protein [Myxococcales bacterium]